MGTNPKQGQNPDPSDIYGGYGGYTPQNPSEDPYGGFNQSGTQQPGTGSQQSDPNYVYGQQQQQYTSGQQQQQQYSGTYQPPLSTMRGSGGSGSNDASVFGLSAKRAGLLSYLVGPFTGLVFLLLERKNQFVRFCAAQSTVVFGAVFVLYLLLRLIMIIPFIGTFLLGPIISGCIIPIILVPAGLLWIFLMVQAYRGVQVKLPIVGDYAQAFLARFSRNR